MVWTDSDSDEENMLNINDLTALNKVNNKYTNLLGITIKI